MKKFQMYLGAIPQLLLIAAALYQIISAAINGSWLLVCGVLALCAAVIYLEKAANIAMVVFSAGAMVTAMSLDIQSDWWHVVTIVCLGLLAGYHLKLIEKWKIEQARVPEEKTIGKYLVAAYLVAIVIGVTAVAFLKITWVNIALVLLFAVSVYESYLTYRPKASDFRIVCKD